MRNKINCWNIPVIVLFLLCFTTTVLSQSHGPSQPAKIVAVLSRNRVQYENALEGIKEYLIQQKINHTLEFVETLGDNNSTSALITRIRSVQPDMILAIGTNAAITVSRDIKNIPIVVSMVLSKNFNNSRQNNVTGVTLTVPPSIQFRIVKNIMHDITSLGVMYNAAENGTLIGEAHNAAGALNIDLIDVELRNEREVPRALQNIIRFTDGIWLIIDNHISRESRRYIINQGLNNNIPIIGFGEITVDEGALLAVTCTDYMHVGRQAGKIAASIIDGTPPADIPFENPEKVTLYVNRRFASELGVKIPQKLDGVSEIIYK